MAVHTLPVTVRVEVDDQAKTVHVVIETPAADGEGDVELLRQDVTGSFTGTENADKRRRLRHLLG